jgi:hypothetical protein
VSGYGDFADRYREAGWSPLPLPHGRKVPPPDGYTGYGAPMVSYADLTGWLENGVPVALFPAGHPRAGQVKRPPMSAHEVQNGNIALRLPDGVVGIDIDAYKAEGVDTMNRLVAQLGPLPATWRSSSRDDGRSGIYLFRTPHDLAFGDVGEGVETIRHAHRYVVAAPSTHPGDERTPPGGIYRWFAPDGSAKAPRVDDLPELPVPWVDHLVSRARTALRDRAPAAAADTTTYDALPPSEKARIDAYVETTLKGIRTDLQDSATWGENDRDKIGRGWEKLQADKAIRLAALALAAWNGYSMEQAQRDFVAWAPTGGGWTSRDVEAKWIAQSARAEAQTMPLATPRVDIFAGAQGAPGTAVTAGDGFTAVGSTQQVTIGGDEVDASNPAKALDWLRSTLGRDRLAGMFLRADDIVFTPRVGEDGYIEPKNKRITVEGGAQIRILDPAGLSARIQNRYRIVKSSEVEGPDGEKKRIKSPTLFPTQAALFAIRAADEVPGLRGLEGVIHTPTFRADGSLLSVPGYDEETGTLFLPTGGQPAAPVPLTPSAEDITMAKKWISYMLQDFRFVSDDDRANYIGLMLTPLLRNITPAPYKLGVIEAHQPGSGKTFLARAIMSIYSGIMHAEMPSEEPELVKTITSMLDTQTGAVIVFDNVSGVVRSSALAGLLTSPTFQGRRLGTGVMVDAVNDRLWMITGNNAALGGDLARRSLRVKIDPGVPNPEARTRFAIPDFENWVRAHRGDLLWSMLTLVQHWVHIGSPVPSEIRADSYGKWVAVVGSILAAAGIPGTFDDPLASKANDPDAEEWEDFLAQVHAVHGEEPWTSKMLLAEIAPLGISAMQAATAGVTFRFDYDVLPASLLKGRQPPPSTLTRDLGNFLGNRNGRWFGPYSVRKAHTKDRYQFWTVVRAQ